MKETFYFPHDNNAHNDPKLMNVLMGIGLSGIGIYWILIEIMHQQKDGKISEEEFKNYLRFYSGNEKEDFVEQVLNKFSTTEIFCLENGQIFSKRVLENKRFRKDLKEKRSLAGKKSAEKRALIKDNSTSVEQNSTSVEQGKGKRKEKEKEKEIKKKGSKKTSLKIQEEFSETSFEFSVAKKFLERKKDFSQIQDILKKKSENEIVQDWADEIRKLRELDKRTDEEIIKVCVFVIENEFWAKNVISLKKLREKKNGISYFSKFLDEVKQKQQGKTKQPSKASDLGL